MSALQATAQNSRLVNGRSKCPRPWPDFPNSRTEQRIGEKEQHGAERQDPLDAALLREHSPGEADHTDQERPDHEAARHRRPVLPPHNPSTTGHERQADADDEDERRRRPPGGDEGRRCGSAIVVEGVEGVHRHHSEQGSTAVTRARRGTGSAIVMTGRSL